MNESLISIVQIFQIRTDITVSRSQTGSPRMAFRRRIVRTNTFSLKALAVNFPLAVGQVIHLFFFRILASQSPWVRAPDYSPGKSKWDSYHTNRSTIIGLSRGKIWICFLLGFSHFSFWHEVKKFEMKNTVGPEYDDTSNKNSHEFKGIPFS